MNKTLRDLCTLALMTLCILPAVAQLNGTGYYRVRNAQYSSDYITIANDKFNYVTVISTAGGGLRQFTPLFGDPENAKRRALACAGKYLQTDIHMVDDPDIINPASVIYFKKRNTFASDYDYDMIAQGTGLLALTTGVYPGTYFIHFSQRYLNVVAASGSGANTQYTASIRLQADDYSSMADIGTRYFIDDNGTFAINESMSAANAKWYIEPVTHFNVQPDFTFNGKYYTTLKVPFECQLDGQVEKAYIISNNNDGVLEYEVIATTGGTVPAGTPVILECGSDNAAYCQIKPLGAPLCVAADTANRAAPPANESSLYSATNLLTGTYFSNTDGKLEFETKSGTSSFNADHRTLATDPQKYIIGFDESGKLGFVKATYAVMPANKAWMLSGGLFSTVATPTITPASGTYTGAQTVTITGEEGATIEYSTDGGSTWQTYTEEITITESTTIQARATKQGLYNNSDVASAEFVIEAPVQVIPGDANNDGQVSISDIATIIDYLLGYDVVINEANADANKTGEITIGDVTAIIDILLGLAE